MTKNSNENIRENFQCLQCGECCRGEGYVRVTPKEMKDMALYLNLTLEIFMKQYAQPSPLGGYWLKEKANRDCIFLEENKCLVHPVKPEQCRTYPYKWLNNDSEECCPALKNLKEK